jgi:hypothetical protein
VSHRHRHVLPHEHRNQFADRPFGVLVGSGPSLESIDLAAVRASGAAILAINHAADWITPDAWIGFDAPKEFPDDLWFDPGIVKLTRSWNRPEYLQSGRRCFEAKNVAWLPVVERLPVAWYWHAPSVPWSLVPGERLTFLASFRLAWELGIRRLVLLGVDWQTDPAKSYAGDRCHTPEHCDRLNRRFAHYGAVLTEMDASFRVRGLVVENATPGSRLEAFTRSSPDWLQGLNLDRDTTGITGRRIKSADHGTDSVSGNGDGSVDSVR